MKSSFLLPLILCVALLPVLRAQDITTTDGQLLKSSSIRRTGSTIMVKVTTPEGSSIEMGIPPARIVKISFPEPPELAKASTASSSGNATEVLSLTGDYVAKEAELKDLPGSWWPEMSRLRLLALAGTAKDADTATLAREIGSLKSPDADSLSRGGTLFANLPSGDKEAVIVGAKAIPRIGGGQGSALAQLALGRTLLAKKDYPGALRAFLTIKVFYPSVTLLQPAALLGAAKAYVGLKDEKRAAEAIKDLSESYPSSPMVPDAKKLSETLSKP